MTRMQKIISLFCRNSDYLVRDEVVAGAEWVLNAEGQPTRKFDGTCCQIEGGKLFKRYEVKKGRQPPAGLMAATTVDPKTGKQQGWLPVGDGPEDRWFQEALGADFARPRPDGTYELCGPKVQGNPEGFSSHVLVRHGGQVLDDCPREFEGIKAFLAAHDIEGIVWHHPDGRMAKIKRRDFGLKRGETRH